MLSRENRRSILLVVFLVLATPVTSRAADPEISVPADIVTPEARDAADRLQQFATGHACEPQKIRFVYFTPSDRTPIPDYRERLARVMKDVQNFYGKEMERHGLGHRSIQFDLDAKGALVLYDVKGLHPAADYLGRDQKKGYGIRDECRPVLKAAGIDDQKETIVYFCHLRTEQDGKVTGIGPYYGSGAQRGAFRWGHCWFTDASILDPDKLTDKTTMVDDEEYKHISVGRYNSHFIGGALHELGHGLRLPHDKERKDESVRGRSLMFGILYVVGECDQSTPLGDHLSSSVVTHPIPWINPPTICPRSIPGLIDSPMSISKSTRGTRMSPVKRSISTSEQQTPLVK